MIDTSGTLYIYSSSTGELFLSAPLRPFHSGASILSSDVEGDSEEGPILVTGADDGSIHVLGISVSYSNREGGLALTGYQY